jgi:hypothetical protein
MEGNLTASEDSPGAAEALCSLCETPGRARRADQQWLSELAGSMSNSTGGGVTIAPEKNACAPREERRHISI